MARKQAILPTQECDDWRRQTRLRFPSTTTNS